MISKRDAELEYAIEELLRRYGIDPYGVSYETVENGNRLYHSMLPQDLAKLLRTES